MKGDFLIVHKKILPDYFEKVLQARRMVESGNARDVSAAVRTVGISRSTYYKYKDYIYSPDNGDMGRKAVLSMVLCHEIGILSTALNLFSGIGASVLTISQSMPIRGSASVVITIDIVQMNVTIDEAIQQLRHISGVESVELVAIE